MAMISIRRCMSLRDRETHREFVVTEVGVDVVAYRARAGRAEGEVRTDALEEVFEVLTTHADGTP